ncbi:DEAD/DEAH box helicase [uncultured Turicimonas sp.]|uniref:DEAD/DEAH box helicase n=1 Tax=uncultured Turicimonas sp. TaxID=1918607 RepID=UPI003211B953
MEDLSINSPVIIHLFSNILDLASLDLKAIASLATKNPGDNYYVCVGPRNTHEQRIPAFKNYFEAKKIDSYLAWETATFGSLSNGHLYTGRFSVFHQTIEQESEPLPRYSSYPPNQLLAGFVLDCIGITGIEKEACSFDVIAPFDYASMYYEERAPFISVLNNLVARGLPTKASPFIEEVFLKEFGVTKKKETVGTIVYPLIKTEDVSNKVRRILKGSPIGVAWIEKLFLDLCLTRCLSFDEDQWDILVIERDFPCAAIAFEELQQMFEHLLKLSKNFADISLPIINLTIISNKNFKNSGLHLNKKTFTSLTQEIKKREFDLVIDIGIEQLSDPFSVEFPEVNVKNKCSFNVRKAISTYAKRLICTSERIQYRPLGEVSNTGEFLPDNSSVDHLRYFLSLLFRKKDFREGQLPILNRALQLESVIGLLPTGGGKSLTYQLSALLQPGVTLVVDPLNSLMKDQYDSLRKNGIDSCTFINSIISTEEKQIRQDYLVGSNIHIIFVSPERLAIKSFRWLLSWMKNLEVYFAYGVIDEVHCVSEWGHDFRFSYLHLGRNLYQFAHPKEAEGQSPHITIFGLTATASFDVLADVERELSGENTFKLSPDAIVRFENTNRLELQYKVIPVPVPHTKNKWDIYEIKNAFVPSVIAELYQNMKELCTPDSIKFIKENFLARENIIEPKYKKKIEEANISLDLKPDWMTDQDGDSLIVFCPHRTGSLGVNDGVKNGVSSIISRQFPKIRLSKFMGGSSLEEQDKFVSNKTNVMVATKAFGMGIDKSNIRFTININHSGSLEAFVQEAGRAGRDQKMALSVILYADQKIEETNPGTGMKENIAVDYGIHKYFFDNSFKGEKYEKRVLYFLMQYAMTYWEERRSTEVGFFPIWEKASGGERLHIKICYDLPPQEKLSFSTKFVKSTGKSKYTSEDYCVDIQKAIYRMVCIGAFEDYTIDYSQKVFEITLVKKNKGEYYRSLQNFLTRYYTSEQAAKQVERAKNYRGNNELQKCLGYLTDFIYSKIAFKRKQAIEDIELFCNEAVHSDKDWKKTNEDLKDFIYYYFNSKYAREGFTSPTGEPYCLTTDTDRGKESRWDVVFKYIKVVDPEQVGSGSPKDNIKHLQGAIRLIRRALTEINPALSLLNYYCLSYLKPEGNVRLLADQKDSFIAGYSEFYKQEGNKERFFANIERFRSELLREDREILAFEEIEKFDELQLMAEIEIHIQWMKTFLNRFADK